MSSRRRPEFESCPEGQFTCASGECIDESLLCDGVADCECECDESPEICALPVPETCPEGQFKCASGECINESLLCNGVADCECECDESPEICAMIDGMSSRRRPEFVTCPEGQFTCNSGECIDGSLLCDGVADCECE